MDTDHENLVRLKESLTAGLRTEEPLTPEQGDVAFEKHILLAVRFHRASALNAVEHGEGKGWNLYFTEHFPKRPEWRAGDADLLWERWRGGLVKLETPLSLVTVTHGQPHAHWARERDGSLCLNLESMWDDFDASVDSFIGLLGGDENRRARALDRWRKHSRTVRQLDLASPLSGFIPTVASATAMGPPSPEDERKAR